MSKVIIEENVLKFQEVLDYFLNEKEVIIVSNNRTINFEVLSKIIDKKDYSPNIYAILIRKDNLSKWKLKYIGQRKSKFIKERLKQHLLRKHEKTGAQLENVKNYLDLGYDIGIKLFSVIPDELRQFYEQKLIQSIEGLSWNKHK